MSLQERRVGGMEIGKQEKTVDRYEIRPYKPEEAQKIFDELEVPNWAPWLRASPEVLAKRAEVFPEGQISMWDNDKPIANVSLARFSWDGNKDTLKTWDELMGFPSTGENTFDPNGNSLGMMSINIHPDYQGQGIARDLIASVKETADRLGVKNIMGSFRPNQFGEYSTTKPNASVSEYINSKREDNLPTDAWLRTLARNGMKMLRVDDAAMVVPDVSREQFDEYKRTYNTERWKQIAPAVWRCGETGIWFVGEKSAVYAESNVWGIIDQGNNTDLV